MSGINVVREPKVYLVGRQQVADEGLYQFLLDHGIEGWGTDTARDAEILPEVAGRLCYMSFKSPRPGGNKAYIGHIIESGHGSVLEHAVWNFIVTGVSRSFTHELVRHRIGMSYSQLSQRFVDETKGGVLDVVVPPALLGAVEDAQRYIARFQSPYPSATAALDYARRHFHIESTRPTPQEDIGLVWLASMEEAKASYNSLADYLADAIEIPEGAIDHTTTARRKAAREAARSALPNATETKIFVTGNCRAVRHFIEMRADPAADAEMRRVALKVFDVVSREAPNLFDDYERTDDGITTPNPKV